MAKILAKRRSIIRWIVNVLALCIVAALFIFGSASQVYETLLKITFCSIMLYGIVLLIDWIISMVDRPRKNGAEKTL